MLLYVHSFEKGEMMMMNNAQNAPLEKEKESIRTELAY